MEEKLIYPAVTIVAYSILTAVSYPLSKYRIRVEER